VLTYGSMGASAAADQGVQGLAVQEEAHKLNNGVAQMFPIRFDGLAVRIICERKLNGLVCIILSDHFCMLYS